MEPAEHTPGRGSHPLESARRRPQNHLFHAVIPARLMSDKDLIKPRDDHDGLAVAETRPRTKRPQLYRVLLLNDDYTPMEFVVIVLQRFFAKRREDAVRIMLHVHTKGIGVCGVYTREVAETKVKQVMDFALENQHPLQCTMEPD